MNHVFLMISMFMLLSVNVQSQQTNIEIKGDTSNKSISQIALENDTTRNSENGNSKFKKSKYIESRSVASNHHKVETVGKSNSSVTSSENLKSEFNPLTNMHIDQLNVKVRNQMQMNKNKGTNLFDGICLVYAIKILGDTALTNYSKIRQIWQKQAHFIDLKVDDAGALLLCLNPYFDTELSEEIMNINHLNVMFKEEYYALINHESER